MNHDYFPLPALYCGLYILLPCTCPQLFIRDDISPEDTEYLPESLIQKGLYLELENLKMDNFLKFQSSHFHPRHPKQPTTVNSFNA